MKIAVTGHRPDKLGKDYLLESPFVKMIKKRLEEIVDEKQPTHMITGMALGIDTLWAKIAIEKDIPLIAAIPFIGQELVWPRVSRETYKEILDWHKTTKIIVSEGSFAHWKMQARNEWMVNHCDLLVAVWNGTSGGTANCIKYAESLVTGKEILLVDLIELKRQYDTSNP
jgi:uncharacterized phage-like protein YoqJ